MKRRSLIALTLAALVFAGCDSAERISSPSRSADYIPAINGVGDYPPTLDEISQSWGGSAVITSSGGTVTAGPHSLTVYPGAVNQPTLFRMTVAGSNQHVKLHAYQGNKWRKEIHYFSAPVALTVSYAASNVADPSRLTIAYLVDGTETGPREYIASTVNTTDQTVSAFLPHFSDYVVALQ